MLSPDIHLTTTHLDFEENLCVYGTQVCVCAHDTHTTRCSEHKAAKFLKW
jgi:hypothetical protein